MIITPPAAMAAQMPICSLTILLYQLPLTERYDGRVGWDKPKGTCAVARMVVNKC